jgi:hypothetical protein
MPSLHHELEVRTALADLTSDQPQAPAGRYAAVRRRAIVRRRHQLVATLAAVVAMAAAAGGLTLLPGLLRVQPAARPVPGWALPWPDLRNGSVPQPVLDRAVIAWQDSGNGSAATEPPAGSSPSAVARLASRYHVIWYAGQTTVRGQVVVVIFEVDGPAGPRLVAGWADAENVMRDQPAWSQGDSPWELTSVPAPRPGSPATVIGIDTHGLDTSTTQNPDDWMVLLAAPGTSAISWQEADHAGILRPDRGLAIRDMGQITAAIELTRVYTNRNVLRRPEYVGVPGASPDTPQLALAPPLSPPGGFGQMDGFAAQGEEADEIGPLAAGRHYLVLARCYGPQSVRIAFDGHQAGVVRCDDGQHELAIPAAWLPARQAMLSVQTSMLTSWQIAFGTGR